MPSAVPPGSYPTIPASHPGSPSARKIVVGPRVTPLVSVASAAGVDLDAEPRFKIGDVVEFEISLRMTPRWDMNKDAGPTNVWYEGQVTGYNVDGPHVMIVYKSLDGRLNQWAFPLLGSSEYMPGQWNFPGYLRHKKPAPATVCECGANHTSTPHLHLSYCALFSDPFKKKK